MEFKMLNEDLLQDITCKFDSTINDKLNKRNINCNRKSKNRSVYGQPSIQLVNQHISSTNSIINNHWKSLDSLDYSESNQSFSSNSTSLSDLRTIEYSNNVQTNNRNQTDVGVSDLGTSVESFDNEQETNSFKRCPSFNSTSSGCSLNDSREELIRETKYFMKQFVDKIFNNSSLISLEEKAKFGSYSRIDIARLWFARFINKKRNENKCVNESTFYSLAQYFAIILFECSESDDFTPAKILMNMSFTYYYINNNHTKMQGPWALEMMNRRQNSLDINENINNQQNKASSTKQYLYTVLRDQPIWKLIRFWQASFFDAVQCERANYYENHKGLNKDKFYDWQFHANVTFGQLGTFTMNMHSFGLPKQFCLEFLHKQSTIANLTSEQVQILKENIESMYKRG